MIVKFYGILADHTRRNALEVPALSNIAELIHYLEKEYPGLKKYSFRIAINAAIINDNAILHNEDQVSLIPPFPGG